MSLFHIFCIVNTLSQREYFLKGSRVKTPPIIPVSIPKSIPPKHALDEPHPICQRGYRYADEIDPPVVDLWWINSCCFVAGEKDVDHPPS
jgi:hypothetical protein